MDLFMVVDHVVLIMEEAMVILGGVGDMTVLIMEEGMVMVGGVGDISRSNYYQNCIDIIPSKLKILMTGFDFTPTAVAALGFDN